MEIAKCDRMLSCQTYTRTVKGRKNMKYFIVLFIACTLFPVTMQAQRGNVMSMYYADDTLEVKYTKDMLQGKWIPGSKYGEFNVSYKIYR